MRSTVTANQLIYDAKNLLGIRDSIHPNDTESMRFLNYSIFTLSNLLDGLYSIWEKKTVGLTIAPQVGKNVTGADYWTYDFGSATFSSDPHGMTSAFNGGLAIFGTLGTVYAAVIDSLTTTTVTLRRDPAGLNITAGNLYAIFLPFGWLFSQATLSSLSIKKINAVYDTVNGNATRLSASEYVTFENNPNFNSNMGLWDFADRIFLKRGVLTSPYGTVTLHYNADPTEITAMTDSIDLETEHHSMIISDVARQIEKAYPDLGKRQNQADPFASLRNLYDSVQSAFVNKKMGLEVAGRAEAK